MARYPFPWHLFMRLAPNLSRGERSLVGDCSTMVKLIKPSPVVSGVEHVPRTGSFLLVANHYQRRGLWIAWPGAVITLAVWEQRCSQPDVHWLVTGGLRLLQTWGRGPEVPLSGRVLRSVARAYDMTALPLEGAAERAVALRQWLRHARRGGVIGLFPEGTHGGARGLVRPEYGLESLCRVLETLDVPILPVGVFETGETLHASFGRPRAVTRGDGEDAIMTAIAGQLPPRLHGPYRPGVSAAGDN